MTYKGMFLSALLMPVSIYCVQDIDLHLQNLNKKQVKKLQELSDISAKIAEKQALIESWDKQFRALCDTAEISYTVLEELSNSFVQKFDEAFCEKKDVKSFLSKDFSVGKDYEFDFIKVFLVRRHFERLLIANLVERYETCLQELLILISNIA